MNTQKQIILIVALFFVFVGTCGAYSAIDLPIRSKHQSDFFQSESVERGALLFANNCRTCHGIKGQGGVGLQLNGSDRDWQNQDPLVLASNKAILHTTLYCGRAGTLMPAWLNTNGGSLNARQIDHLIDFITSPLDDKYKDEEGATTSQGWFQAVEFAHNLNRESSGAIGGDTVGGIAKQHHIGEKEFSGLNGNRGMTEILPKDTIVQMPDFYPGSKTYHVFNTNETLAKIMDTQGVSASYLANFNKLAFSIDKKGNFSLLGDDGKPVPGLFPGDKLAFPDATVYAVRAADTLTAIADKHGLTTSAIVALNRETLASAKTTDPLSADYKLKLPPDAFITATIKDTVGTIATAHGLKPEDIIAANKFDATKVLAAGDKVVFPASSSYIVSTGDTLASIAAAHNIKADDLAKLNNLPANTVVTPEVILQLPKVDKYLVAGQSFDDVAKTYGGVSADDFATANGRGVKDVLRIGTSLKLPPGLWGATPPDAKNPGTACVEHALPESVFKDLFAPAVPITKPDKQSSSASFTAHADDWTITADGTDLTPNKSGVSIKKGTAVQFKNAVGLHTINVNGLKQGDDFKVGDTRSISFNDAGEFKITCGYHPDMKASVFVE